MEPSCFNCLSSGLVRTFLVHGQKFGNGCVAEFLSSPREGVVLVKKNSVRDGLRRKLEAALGQGMSAERIALSFTVGLLMGLIPLVWGSCLLCLVIGWHFRLSHPIIQLLNYGLYPLQIALLVPFFYAGGWLFNQPQLFNQTIVERFMSSPLTLLDQVWQANLYALVTWAGLSVVVLPLVYMFALTIVRRLCRGV